jgi:hypothetical protein
MERDTVNRGLALGNMVKDLRVGDGGPLFGEWSGVMRGDEISLNTWRKKRCMLIEG